MRLIDQYAYSTRSRMVDPAHKLVLSLSVIVLCLVLDRPLVGFVAALGMWILANRWAGTPARVFGGVLAAEAMFLVTAVVGVAISVGAAPPAGSWWGTMVGPWWVGTTQSSVDLAARLVARALGGAAAMNFLALTTPLVDLMEVMRRLRVPPVLVDLMVVMYRFTFTLLDSLARMHTAQESRLGYASFQRGMVSAGLLAGGLFADACRRTARVQTALESRCYDVDLRVLPLTYRRDLTLLVAGTALVAAQLVVWRLA
ncbi:MAG TPA: cobalt ECF transporter T component CbiQ [Chloroflexota bacterium]